MAFETKNVPRNKLTLATILRNLFVAKFIHTYASSRLSIFCLFDSTLNCLVFCGWLTWTTLLTDVNRMRLGSLKETDVFLGF